MVFWRKKESSGPVEWTVHVFPDMYGKSKWVEGPVTFMEGDRGWGWIVWAGDRLAAADSCATREEAFAQARSIVEGSDE